MKKQLNIANAKRAMEAKGYTQTALAKKLDVSKEAVSQWLNQKIFPRPNKLLGLGKLLELSFDDLVIKDEPSAPLVSFRKVAGAKTKNHHIEKAQDMGRFLSHLVPFLPFDSLEMPPVLKAPTCDYEYLQKVAQKVRSDINVEEQSSIDFTHLIRRFNELQAVIIPVLWGSKQRHENALHIYLPESQTTWVYLNLDVNVHDFKFWMAHELGHCLSPTLTDMEASEDFADAFAGALLFPEQKASAAYVQIASQPTVTARIARLLEIADEEVISPYTVFMQANSYAENYDRPKLSLGNKYYAAITNFNKRYKNISEVIFKDLDDLSPKDYIHETADAFDTPFFDVLSQYLRKEGKGPGIVHSITDMPLLDARSMYAELI